MSIPRIHYTTALDRHISYQFKAPASQNDLYGELNKIYRRLAAALSINPTGKAGETLAQRVQCIQNKATNLIFKVVHEVLEGTDPNALGQLHEELKSLSLAYQKVDAHFKALKFPPSYHGHLGLNYLQMKLSWVKSTLDQFNPYKITP